MAIGGHLCLSVTPFTPDGSVDLESLGSLVNHLIAGDVDGVIVLGSTGEFFSLDRSERMAVVETAVAACGGRVPVIAGVGATGTTEAALLTSDAVAAGAAAIMVPPPFYAPAFFSTAAGIEKHILEVAAAADDAEVMLYDGGGGIEIPVETTARVAELAPNITMVKLTVPMPQKALSIRKATAGRVGVLCGNDALTLYELALGVDGVAIGVGNIVPGDVSKVVHGYRAGDKDTSRSLFYNKVLPIASIALCSTAQFVQVFKLGLAKMGVITSDHVRQPLLPLDETRISESLAALEHVGVLS